MDARKFNFSDEDLSHSHSLLGKLEKNAGNCIMDGFLGEDFLDLSFDDEGRLQFMSNKKIDDTSIDSIGVVLSDSVLIRQVEQNSILRSYRLYSWDVDRNLYTFLEFDDKSSWNHFFDVIKRFDICLCGGDISSQFQEMGLTFESVTQILLNQRVDPLSRMFDDEFSEEKRSISL